MAASQPSPAKVPKAMSSRLMTMKFMQRAAATSQEPSPLSQDQHSSKRQRLSIISNAQDVAIQAQSAIEDVKQAEAITLQAARAGETRWVFSLLNTDNDAHLSEKEHSWRGLQVVTTGYASIDSNIHPFQGADYGTLTNDKRSYLGRMKFGKLEEEEHDNSSHPPSDLEASEDEKAEENEDDSAAVTRLIKTERKEARRVAKQKRQASVVKRRAEETTKRPSPKKVKLRKLSAISDVRVDGKGDATVDCHRCGEMGHRAKNCLKEGPGKRHR